MDPLMSNQATDKIIAALIKNDAYKMNLDAVTINHSAWPQPFRFTRNYVPGGSFTFNGDVYQYLPMLLSRAGQDGNLNQTWSITLQDLNDEVQAAENLIPIDSTEYPTIEIRTFEYDKRDQTVILLEGPYATNTAGISYDSKGAFIEAAAERVNINGTGFKMSSDRFGTLRPSMR